MPHVAGCRRTYAVRMASVMAVSFERYGRLYYLDPGGRDYRVGDRVLVPTESGAEVAECVWAPEWVDGDGDGGFGDLPVCAGPAEVSHLERDALNRRLRAQAKLVAKQLIRGRALAMKVVGVDVIDAGGAYDQLTVIYFTAPHRVDFRALVGELARALRSRVDLRQVGSRDAARLTGGVGSCGRDLCCATFLSDFEPVSLRMAKDQDLPPNPLKISGACGRLMCCLKYEHPLYVEFAASAPLVGSAVTTEEGDGVVVGHSVPADAVLVRMKQSGQVASCAKAGVCGSRQVFATRTVVEGDPVGEPVSSTSQLPTPQPTSESTGQPRTRQRRRSVPPG